MNCIFSCCLSALKIEREADFKTGSLLIAFHLNDLIGRGDILLEDDIPVQQVVYSQVHIQAAVDGVAGGEVHRVDRLLLDIPQLADANGVDAAPLQVVEQCQREFRSLLKRGE